VRRFQHALMAAWAAALLGGNAMAKETIVIGDVSWEASHAVSNVLKVVIESRLGADVKIIPADQAAIFAAMDKGDGSIDVHPELWLPAQADRHAKFIAAGSKESVLVNDKPYIGSDGLYVPGFVQDKYGVKSVQQLADPKIAKLFDTDGSGKGSYWPGAPGWNGVNIQLVRAKGYGFDKTMKPFVVADAVMRAELAKAFAQQKPFVLYFWEPEGLFKKYDLRKLEEPAYSASCYKMVQPQEAPDWQDKAKITCAGPATTVHVAYSKSLTKRAPKVAQFLKQVSFDLPTLNEWILKVSDKVDPAVLAKEWVAANPEKVNAWLAGVK
jgi:glycine betaine/proline transport system substrate-binding protein